MDEPTLYELLGVTPAASLEEIRAAHRRLLRAAHPDAGGTAGLFRTVQAAYETLADPVRRAAYDASLRGSSSGPAWSDGPRSGDGTRRDGTTGQSGRRDERASAYPTGSGRASIYQPMERPPHMEAAAVGAIFDPPLFGGDESGGRARRRGFGPIGGRHRTPSGPVAATDLLPMEVLRQRVIGTPGAGYEELSRPAEFEREAARRTEELLDAAVLPGYPAMRLVHDLRDPGTRASILDHAVVVGDRVVLVDSVMAGGRRVRWDGRTLWSDTAGEVPVAGQSVLEQVRLWLDPWRVDLVVVVHAASGKLAEPEIVRTGDSEVSVMGPLELVDALREAALLEPRTHVVNVRLLRAVLKLRPDALG